MKEYSKTISKSPVSGAIGRYNWEGGGIKNVWLNQLKQPFGNGSAPHEF